MNLSSKERAFLKKAAHAVEPVVRIGKEGIDGNLIKSVKDAVTKRELIKVKILQNSDIKAGKEVGEKIAQESGSTFVDCIGNVLILFKMNVKEGKLTKEFNEFRRKGKK